jgi:hypothetical protein
VQPVSLWPATATPAQASNADASSVNLGVRFTSSVAGSVTGLRFYKGAGNGGTHVGSLWDNAGNLLARATFSNETATGWQQVNFATPVAVAAGTPYVASYLAPQGRYAIDSAFAWPRTAAPLTGLAGVYTYGSTSLVPTQTWNASNYWVDVVFAPGEAPPPPPPPPPPPATGTAALTWDASTDPRTIGYRVYWGTAPGSYAQAYGQGVLVTSPTYTVSGLATGRTWYFAVTAVAEGLESAYSAEATKALP